MCQQRVLRSIIDVLLVQFSKYRVGSTKEELDSATSLPLLLNGSGKVLIPCVFQFFHLFTEKRAKRIKEFCFCLHFWIIIQRSRCDNWRRLCLLQNFRFLAEVLTRVAKLSIPPELTNWCNTCPGGMKTKDLSVGWFPRIIVQTKYALKRPWRYPEEVESLASEKRNSP